MTHGAGLTAIWPTWARYVYKNNVERFVRFAVNVMSVSDESSDPEGTALRGIDAMEKFYKDIKMPVTLRELLGREVTDCEINELARKCSHDGSITVGNLKVLSENEMREIYSLAR